MICPVCHKADAITITEFSSVSKVLTFSAAVALPIKVCGRCGIAVADAALRAAEAKLAEMRRGTEPRLIKANGELEDE